MNKQAQSFRTCGHMSNLTFGKAMLLEVAHFLHVLIIESSQNMNSYNKSSAPSLPVRKQNPPEGTREGSRRHRTALGRLQLADHGTAPAPPDCLVLGLPPQEWLLSSDGVPSQAGSTP